MRCPKCNSDLKIKNGWIRNLQRYMCKNCSNNYTVTQKSYAVDKKQKRQALVMYLQGMSISAIARIVNVSHVSVRRWINQYSNSLSDLIEKKDGIPDYNSLMQSLFNKE